MKTVWKYTIDRHCDAPLDMPHGAQVLTVSEQHGKPQLWALVDPTAPKERRTFNIYGTGWPINGDPGKYIGTFFIDGGSLVFHLFEVTP